jgi:hypothetical protein
MKAFKSSRGGETRKPETAAPSLLELLSNQQQQPAIAMGRPKNTKVGFLEALGHGLKAGLPAAKQAAKVAYEQGREKQNGSKNEQRVQPSCIAYTAPKSTLTKGIPQDQHLHDISHATQSPLGSHQTLEVSNIGRTHSAPAHLYAPETTPSIPRLGTIQTENPLLDSYDPSAKTTLQQDEVLFDAQIGCVSQLYRRIVKSSRLTREQQTLARVNGVPQMQEPLLKTGIGVPKLRSQAGEQFEGMTTRGSHGYRELSHSLDVAHRPLDSYRTDAGSIQSLQTEVQTLRNELRASKTEVHNRRQEANNNHQQMLKAQNMLGEQNVKFEQERRHLESEMEGLKYHHASQMHTEIQKLHSDNDRIKAWYEEQLRAVRHEEEKRHEQNISSVKHQLHEERWNWDARLREVKETYETRIRDLEASSNERMKNEYERHCEEMRQEKERHGNTVNEYKASIARLKLDAELEQRRLHELLQTEQERFQEEQKRREKELKRQEAKLTKKYTNETLQLRTVNEELKQGLFDRKHFRGLKDRDLGNLFRSIAGQVQDFANMEWNGPTSDWPFDEHQLLDIHGENTRKLKKQIVQNTVWLLLYDYIFASPFKIFGSEGEILDRDWIDIYTPSKS